MTNVRATVGTADEGIAVMPRKRAKKVERMAPKLADERAASAIQHLVGFDSKADPLRELARYITARKN